MEAHGDTLEAVIDTAAGKAFIVQTRHVGVLAICESIALFFVLFFGFNKGAKWAWWAIFLAGGLSWGYSLLAQILESDMKNMILCGIGLLITAFGLLLPMKEFFKKKI